MFVVSPDSRVRGYCHWQANRSIRPTLVLVHGLEGCSESHYMRGIASKAWRAGFNVIRLNQRNCGGTERDTPTLYHNGLSGDLRSVVGELTEKDGLDAIWLAGYSMGGNLVLRMAGEAGNGCPALRGAVAVCPNINPAACIDALERPRNWIYHRYFLESLKARLRRKAELFPGRFDLGPLARVRSLREFDHLYTAPDGGFSGSADYYERSGAGHLLGGISVPTLIITAEDDPFIPPWMFRIPVIEHHPWITLVLTRHGGHCGFFQRPTAQEDPFWAEHRLLEFISGEEKRGAAPRAGQR